MRESRSSHSASSSAPTFDFPRWRMRHWIGHGVAAAALILTIGAEVVEYRGKAAAQEETRGVRRELVDAWREVEEVRRAKMAGEVKAREEAADLGQRLAKEGEERRRSEREAGEARTQLWAMWGRAQSYRAQWEAAQKERMSAEAEVKERVVFAEKQKEELQMALTESMKAAEDATQREQEWKVRLARAEAKATLLKNPHGRVVSADPQWGFLVVNVGDQQGVKPNGMLVVARDGSAIGKVKVTSVERDQAVAEMVPGTFGKGAGVRRGDLVVGE